MLNPFRMLYGSWVKWQVLKYLGVKRRRRFRHLVITDAVSLRYWEKMYRHSKER